jgi:spore photoproduct lyase
MQKQRLNQDEQRNIVPPFSYIYVEKKVLNHPRTEKILKKIPRGKVILIDHYKDVFCRKKQSVSLQNQAPMLILAAKEGRLIYEGAPVCQSFGNEFFYYTSCVMNCIYNCEYCYLKGMYPSGNIVIFVNLEDIFQEVEQILKKHPVYLCVSYDTDLIALEDVTGFVGEWIEFARNHRDLRIEVRTKCGRRDLWQQWRASENIIFAFTISPEWVVEQYEHRTASLQERLLCAKIAMEQGFLVRLCFDPMIYCPNWRTEYEVMMNQVEQRIDIKKLYDVSVGSFRISQDYMKNLRREMTNSAVVQFPFENEGGVYHYPGELMEEMEKTVVQRLENNLGAGKIFRWDT